MTVVIKRTNQLKTNKFQSLFDLPVEMNSCVKLIFFNLMFFLQHILILHFSKLFMNFNMKMLKYIESHQLSKATVDDR